MTVADLIAKLADLPPDLPVFVSTDQYEGGLSPVKVPGVEHYRHDPGADFEYVTRFEDEDHTGECVILGPEEYS